MKKSNATKEEILRYIDSVLDDEEVKNVTIEIKNTNNEESCNDENEEHQCCNCEDENKCCHCNDVHCDVDDIKNMEELGWFGEREYEPALMMHLIKSGLADDFMNGIHLINTTVRAGEVTKADEKGLKEAINKFNHVFQAFAKIAGEPWTLKAVKVE